MAVRSDPGKKKPPTLWTVTTARWVIQRAYPIIATRLLFSIVLKSPKGPTPGQGGFGPVLQGRCKRYS